MYKNNMTIIKILSVLLCCFLSVPIISQEYTGWRVKSDSDGLEFAMAIDNSFKGIELDLKKNKYPKAIESESYLILLKEYMKLARENRPKRIMSMYSIDDGSLEQYQKEIKRDPNKFSRFNIVEKIVVDEIVKWGDYRAVNIRLYGKDGLLTPFTELFHCNNEDSCKLSDRLYRLNEAFSFFAAVMVLVPNSSKVDFQQKGFIPISYAENTELPVYIKINTRSLKAPLIAKGVEKKPMELKESDDVLNSLNSVELFVRDIWKQENKILLSQRADNADKKAFYAKSMQVTGSVYKKYWNEDQNSNLISNYKLIKSITLKKASDLKDIQPHSSTNYTGYSFAQLLLSWKSYRPLSYLVAEKIIFTWVEYEKSDGSAGILLFSFDKEKQKLTLATNSDVGRLLVNGLIAEQLSNLIGVSTGN